MRWASPHVLHWLWAIVPLAWIVFRLATWRERRLARLVDPQALPLLSPGRLPHRPRTRVLLFLLAIAFLLVALARPQWGFYWEEVKRRGLDIVVVLDTSRSMMAHDIKPNRLQQSEWGIRDLMRQLHGDRLGLVVFAGSSFLQCPLTIDYAAFAMTLDDVYAGIVPRGGTAIEQALRTAIDSFDDTREADRAIVLITDGEDHDGQPLRLIDELKEKRIRVYAIGVGTLEGDLIPESNDRGRAGFVKDRAGNVVKSALTEDTLRQLSLATGGAYVRSAPGDFGLERVFQESIAALQRDESESRMAKVFEERFAWFLGVGLLLLFFEALLKERGAPAKEVAS